MEGGVNSRTSSSPSTTTTMTTMISKRLVYHWKCSKLILLCNALVLLWCKVYLVEGFEVVGGRVGSFRKSIGMRPINNAFHTRSVCGYRNGSRSTLSMHMGHSHSHSHGHSHDHSHNALGSEVGLKKSLLQRSTMTHAAFALVVAMGSALLRRGRSSLFLLQKADLAAFVGTWGVVSLGDTMRNEGKKVMAKVRRWRDDIMRHRPSFGKELAEKEADRVTIIGVWINLLLSVGKLITGITCRSSALVADAGHSLSDLFSDFITLWAVQVARLPPDEDHPYGHGKFEAIGSLFLALTLLATGLSVGAVSNQKLLETIQSQRALLKPPTPPALIMAAASIFSKEWLYRITRKVGERLNSQVVIANAWHHRSDAYSSVLALLSIALAITFPSLIAADAAAGLLVAGMICMTGLEILEESVRQLTDSSNHELVTRLTKLLKHKRTDEPKDKDVLSVDRIRARQVGSAAMVDVSVTTPATLSSTANRAVEQRIKDSIMEQEPNVIDAEIRASAPDVTCPPLLDVEEETKQLLLMHPQVENVTRVTVHCYDTHLVNVDANVRLADHDASSNNLPTTTTTTAAAAKVNGEKDVANGGKDTTATTTLSSSSSSASSMTMQEATQLASKLKSKLEQSENISKANIYLDLN